MSLVRSKVEYATTIWGPHTKLNIDNLEMIQSKGARFVCCDFRRYSSVTEMLQRLQWESLQARRKACKLVVMYKTTNNLVDLSSANFNLQQSPLPPHRFIQPSLALTATNLASSLEWTSCIGGSGPYDRHIPPSHAGCHLSDLLAANFVH